MNKTTDKSLQLSSYLTPRYWPLWFAFGLLRLTAFLPLSNLQTMGSALGIFIYRIVPSRRRAARINLKQAYPDFTDKEIDELNKKAFRSLGISIFETGIAWFTKSDVL
ncbi:MAG: hypothetical protein ACNYZG_08565, partial [Gammaproteobacteria bacterium]